MEASCISMNQNLRSSQNTPNNSYLLGNKLEQNMCHFYLVCSDNCSSTCFAQLLLALDISKIVGL